MSKCSEITCDRDVWNDLDKCILHCKKTDYQSDNQVINFLQHFYDSLVEYIIEYLQYRHEIQYHEREIRQLLSTGGLIQISPTVMTEFRKVMIHLEGIWFPEHDSQILTITKNCWINLVKYILTNANFPLQF